MSNPDRIIEIAEALEWVISYLPDEKWEWLDDHVQGKRSAGALKKPDGTPVFIPAFASNGGPLEADSNDVKFVVDCRELVPELVKLVREMALEHKAALDFCSTMAKEAAEADVRAEAAEEKLVQLAKKETSRKAP